MLEMLYHILDSSEIHDIMNYWMETRVHDLARHLPLRCLQAQLCEVWTSCTCVVGIQQVLYCMTKEQVWNRATLISAKAIHVVCQASLKLHAQPMPFPPSMAVVCVHHRGLTATHNARGPRNLSTHHTKNRFLDGTGTTMNKQWET